MNILPQRRAKPAVSLVPLIDIMVMILIFFIITMAPKEERKIVKLELVQSSEGEAVPSTNMPIAISLDADGVMYLQGEPVTAQQLVESLKKYRAQFGVDWKPVFLYDAQATAQRIVDVASLVKQAGIDVREIDLEVDGNTGAAQ